MAASRKTIRLHLGTLLQTAFEDVIDNIYDHVRMKFPGSAMMISSAGTPRMDPVFKGHVPVHAFDILVFIPRQNEEDENYLDNVSELMSAFIDDNQTSTYWTGIPKATFRSTVSPVNLNKNEQFWFEQYSLEIVAK